MAVLGKEDQCAVERDLYKQGASSGTSALVKHGGHNAKKIGGMRGGEGR